MPSQSVSIDDKGALSRSLAMNFVIYSQKAELDQIRDGFDCVNFSGLVKAHPCLLQPLFVASGRQSPTAAMVLDLFHVEFSLQGSNQRPKEEEIILHWNYYISELEGMTLCTYIVLYVHVQQNESGHLIHDSTCTCTYRWTCNRARGWFWRCVAHWLG